jgi:hypothetical protein
VTAAQIKQALDRYLTGKKKVLIEYLPEGMRGAAQKNEAKKS